MDAYSECDAVDLAELVAGGQASPDELLDEALRRVERLNPALNAVVHMREAVARQGAAGDEEDENEKTHRGGRSAVAACNSARAASVRAPE